MLFIVPDEILEKLKCDYCHRYLSVGPVLVDRNRKQICGRCSTHGNIGVQSIFNILGKQALYKCINRFDGCTILLTQEKVLEHEKNCSSLEFTCPLCEKDEKMPTYELFEHLKVYHGSFWLTKPLLRRKIGDINEKNIYIYVKNDKIFLIYLEHQKTRNVFLLNAIHLGNEYETRPRNMKPKFYDSVNGFTLFNSETVECSSFNVTHLNCAFETPELCNLLDSSFITIHFEITLSVINYGFIKYDLQENIELTKLTRMERQLKIKEEYKSIADAADITVSSCGKKVVEKFSAGRIMEISLQCVCCSTLLECDYCVEYDSLLHLICKCCVNSFVFTDNCKCYIYNKVSCYLLCSCLGSCGYFGEIDEIYSHEHVCEYIEKRKCPIVNCYFKGNFAEMKSHVKIEHGKNIYIDRLSCVSFGTYYIWINTIHIIVKCDISSLPFDSGNISIETDVGDANPETNIAVLLCPKGYREELGKLIYFINECIFPYEDEYSQYSLRFFTSSKLNVIKSLETCKLYVQVDGSIVLEKKSQN